MTPTSQAEGIVERLPGDWTLKQWQENARRDDCLDRMIPSDLRQFLGIIERQQKEIEALRNRTIEECAKVADRFESLSKEAVTAHLALDETAHGNRLIAEHRAEAVLSRQIAESIRALSSGGKE